MDAVRYDGGSNKVDALVDIDAYTVVSSGSGGGGSQVGISVTGTSFVDTTKNDIVTIHYSWSGTALSVASGPTRFTNGGGTTHEYATGLATSANGTNVNIYVGGYSNAPLGGFSVGNNFVVLGYINLGASQWTPFIYNGPGNGDDYAYKIVAEAREDASIAVCVTGTMWAGSTPGNNVITFAFSPSRIQLWTHEISGATDDQVIDMTMVQEGDVYLLTKRFNGTDYDYRTVKIDADTGLSGWSNPPLYGAPYGGPDEPWSVGFWLNPSDPTVTRSPNIYVVGRSRGSLESSNKYATVTYTQVMP